MLDFEKLKKMVIDLKIIESANNKKEITGELLDKYEVLKGNNFKIVQTIVCDKLEREILIYLKENI